MKKRNHLKKCLAIFLCCVFANQNAFAMESNIGNGNASNTDSQILSGLQSVTQGTSSSETKDSTQGSAGESSYHDAVPQTTGQSVSDSSLDTTAPTKPEKTNSHETVLIQPGPKLIAPANKTANVTAQEHEYYCTADLRDILLEKNSRKELEKLINVFVNNLGKSCDEYENDKYDYIKKLRADKYEYIEKLLANENFYSNKKREEKSYRKSNENTNKLDKQIRRIKDEIEDKKHDIKRSQEFYSKLKTLPRILRSSYDNTLGMRYDNFCGSLIHMSLCFEDNDTKKPKCSKYKSDIEQLKKDFFGQYGITGLTLNEGDQGNALVLELKGGNRQKIRGFSPHMVLLKMKTLKRRELDIIENAIKKTNSFIKKENMLINVSNIQCRRNQLWNPLTAIEYFKRQQKLSSQVVGNGDNQKRELLEEDKEEGEL